MYSSTLSPWTEQNTDSHSQPNSVRLSVSMSVPYYFFIPWDSPPTSVSCYTQRQKTGDQTSPGSLAPKSGCIFLGLHSYIYFRGEILKAGLLLEAGPNLKRWLPGTNLTKILQQLEFFFNKDVMFSDFNKFLKSGLRACYAQLCRMHAVIVLDLV